MRAILFDAAGTLISLREPVGETYARAVRKYGGEANAQRLDDAFRATLRSMPPMVFGDRSEAETLQLERDWWRRLVRAAFDAAAVAIGARELEPCFDDLFEHYARREAWHLAGGVRDVLGEIRARGIRSAVVSNFDRRLPRILDELGVAALLDAIVLPSDAGAAKPDRRIFHHALERIGGVAPRDALYVGDDAEEDIAGAEAAGMRAVDVATLGDLRALLDGFRAGAR